jgi:hypothetical protein
VILRAAYRLVFRTWYGTAVLCAGCLANFGWAVADRAWGQALAACICAGVNACLARFWWRHQPGRYP